MRILIVDDSLNIVRLLERIIIDKDLGEVISTSDNGLDGIKIIEDLRPDVVLVDLLMPGKDGISMVKDLKPRFPNMQFIMISQVSSKEMISKAYLSGVEFFISKPIDAIEVESVLRKVIEKVEMNKKLLQIQNLFSSDPPRGMVVEEKDSISEVKRVMQKIGILGDSGSQDIITLVKFLVDNKKSMSDVSIIDLCKQFSDNPKSMEQRIRRTATNGMINLANIGIEDYMNEIFTEYSNGLFNFEQLKIEMDFIRGKTKKRGKVNIKKFLEGLAYYSQT